MPERKIFRERILRENEVAHPEQIKLKKRSEGGSTPDFSFHQKHYTVEWIPIKNDDSIVKESIQIKKRSKSTMCDAYRSIRNLSPLTARLYWAERLSLKKSGLLN